MQTILIKVLEETVQVTLLVLFMMVAVDAINVWTRGKVSSYLRHGKNWRQYFISSSIGVLPGCAGGFTNVSLYIHGMISFGALAGSMVATSGDEAFVMLALFPKTALLLFGILLLAGIIASWLTDKIVKKTGIRTCEDCREIILHENEKGSAHFFREHIWRHIIRRHIFKTAMWTFGALLTVEIGMKFWNLDAISSQYTFYILILSALIGLIPESGPHLLFVTLFANGLVPFSVLFTSSFVQDGHSLLPMLSFSLKDAFLVKMFNMTIGLTVGILLYILGL